MDTILNKQFDEEIENIKGLTWLPWIGKNYSTATNKLLIVGESHYLKEETDEIFKISSEERMKWKDFTRRCIFESAVNNQWHLRTFANIDRVLFGTNSPEEMNNLWSNISYYNIVQRFMNYKERPTERDFLNGWETFIKLIQIIKPTVCIFIGVTASNTYSRVMHSLGVDSSNLEWKNRIGNAYARRATLYNINGENINLHFIQHTSQYFSWSKWRKYLSSNEKNLFNFLGKPADNPNIGINENEENENNNLDLLDELPTHLKHKPIIACDYRVAKENKNLDARFLSIGRAQYDKESSSVKFFRHTGNKWSRQSEEVPIDRVADMTLLLLSTIDKIKNGSKNQSSLGEINVAEEDLSFLESEINKYRKPLKNSLMEIRRIVNKINIEDDLS